MRRQRRANRSFKGSYTLTIGSATINRRSSRARYNAAAWTAAHGVFEWPLQSIKEFQDESEKQ
jgi:hypothetical protein